MKFIKTALSGAYLIELEKKADERGFFARIWDMAEFEKKGMSTLFVQGSKSRTHNRGTLRGMHFQKPPHAENKLVRVTRGAVYDVIVDLRKQSPTYKQWYGVELSAENGRSIYIPEGLAHGFITLSDDVEISYLMTACFKPEAQSGIRYDDPNFNITWPKEVKHISLRDAAYPDYTEENL